MSAKLTIQGIADLAQVSKATVSRVLNGYPHVRPEVRERVRKVIRETGYQPNNIARLLASERSSIIGLVISAGAQMVFSDPYFPALTESISKAAAAKRLVLSLFVSYTEGQGRDTINGILASGLFDGLILTADHRGDAFIPRLREAGIPFVFVGRPGDAEGVHYVDADNRHGGYLATSHLLKLGYRRIAAIGSDQNTAGDDRVAGYRQALRECGLPYDSDLVAYGDFTLESAYRAMKALLPRQPDSVFVGSDTMSLGALRAIREANLRAPDDIALVSHDDLPPAVQADPPLTTVHQPIARTGGLAVEKLARLIGEPDDLGSRQTVLPVQLRIRESCGAARAKAKV